MSDTNDYDHDHGNARNEVPIDYPAAMAAVDAFFNEPDSLDERRTRYQQVFDTMGSGDTLGDDEIENMRRMFSKLGLESVREHIKDHIEGDEWFGSQDGRYKRLHEAYRDAFRLGARSGKQMVSLWNRTVEIVSGTVIDAPAAIIVVINTPPILYVSLKADDEIRSLTPEQMLNPCVIHQSGQRHAPS